MSCLRSVPVLPNLRSAPSQGPGWDNWGPHCSALPGGQSPPWGCAALGVPEPLPLHQGLLPFRCSAGAATPRHGCVASSTSPTVPQFPLGWGGGEGQGLAAPGSSCCILPRQRRHRVRQAVSHRRGHGQAQPVGSVLGSVPGWDTWGAHPGDCPLPVPMTPTNVAPWAFSEAGPAAEQDQTRRSRHELARPPWWRGTPALTRPVGIPTVTGDTMSHGGI